MKYIKHNVVLCDEELSLFADFIYDLDNLNNPDKDKGKIIERIYSFLKEHYGLIFTLIGIATGVVVSLQFSSYISGVLLRIGIGFGLLKFIRIRKIRLKYKLLKYKLLKWLASYK